jgi:CBS domain-containing protein
MTNVAQLLAFKAGPLHAIAPELPVLEAMQVMAEREIGALPVMQGDLLVGIVTERDYARKIILHGRSSATTRVSEVMTASPITVTPDMSAQACMQIMTEQRVRHLPVVEAGRVTGIVSIGDLVRAVLAEQAHTIEQLEAYIQHA